MDLTRNTLPLCQRWLSLPKLQRWRPPGSSGQMVIIVGKDRRVIVDASVDTAALARVLQVLEQG